MPSHQSENLKPKLQIQLTDCKIFLVQVIPYRPNHCRENEVDALKTYVVQCKPCHKGEQAILLNLLMPTLEKCVYFL